MGVVRVGMILWLWERQRGRPYTAPSDVPYAGTCWDVYQLAEFTP